MGAIDELLTVVKAGSLLTLLGNIGVLAVFWKPISNSLHKLYGKPSSEMDSGSAKVLIDRGDGNPVPLAEASRGSVDAAIAALEKRRKS
jgi:hypothetical protein